MTKCNGSFSNHLVDPKVFDMINNSIKALPITSVKSDSQQFDLNSSSLISASTAVASIDSIPGSAAIACADAISGLTDKLDAHCASIISDLDRILLATRCLNSATPDCFELEKGCPATPPTQSDLKFLERNNSQSKIAISASADSAASQPIASNPTKKNIYTLEVTDFIRKRLPPPPPHSLPANPDSSANTASATAEMVNKSASALPATLCVASSQQAVSVSQIGLLPSSCSTYSLVSTAANVVMATPLQLVTASTATPLITPISLCSVPPALPPPQNVDMHSNTTTLLAAAPPPQPLHTFIQVPLIAQQATPQFTSMPPPALPALSALHAPPLTAPPLTQQQVALATPQANYIALAPPLSSSESLLIGGVGVAPLFSSPSAAALCQQQQLILSAQQQQQVGNTINNYVTMATAGQMPPPSTPPPPHPHPPPSPVAAAAVTPSLSSSATQPDTLTQVGNRSNAVSTNNSSQLGFDVHNMDRFQKTEKGRFRCPYCPRKCFLRENMMTHLRTHYHDKPFMCQYCEKSFPQRDHLVAHIRTHTKERPFLCHMCHKGFTQLGNLHRHFKIHQRDGTYHPPE